MLGKQVKELQSFLANKPTDDRIIKGFAVDSRNVQPGFVFFALKGAKVDGHDYLIEAFKKGAIAAVVSKSFEERFPGHTLVYVDDVLASLQSLAKETLAKQKKRIVAITGSMGKTTTKEFAATLLSSHYKVFKTPGNANSQIGLPLSILNKGESEEEIIVLEMGMMGHNQIAKLVQIAPPELAVITKIAPAHLEFFPNGLEGIAKAKSEILSHPFTTSAIINSQACVYSSIVKEGRSKKTFFSIDKDADYKCKDFWLEKEKEGIRIIGPADKSPMLKLPFDVPHLRENFIAAALIARYFNVPWEDIATACSKLELFEKRFEQIERNGVTFINDSYNANPESMKAALSHLPKPKDGGKTILALGHMVELGSICAKIHAEIGEFASQFGDKLLCLGEKCLPMKDGFSRSGKPVDHYMDIEKMQTDLLSQVKPGDVVLIKASNSVRLWRLLDSSKA